MHHGTGTTASESQAVTQNDGIALRPQTHGGGGRGSGVSSKLRSGSISNAPPTQTTRHNLLLQQQVPAWTRGGTQKRREETAGSQATIGTRRSRRQYAGFDDGSLKTAVNMWCANSTTAKAKYGEINTWNTSGVKTMKELFKYKRGFNENINSWQTEKVTSMSQAFSRASKYNQPLGKWRTGNVVSLAEAFASAGAWNQDIDLWQVGLVTTMAHMLSRCDAKGLNCNDMAFNQPMNSWQANKVETTYWMFYRSVFNQPQNINAWQTSAVTSMDYMFRAARVFNRNIDSWQTSSVCDFDDMFMFMRFFNQPLDWQTGSVKDLQHMSGIATTRDAATLLIKKIS